MERRTLLRLVACSATAGLAGCGGGTDDAGTDSTPSPTPSPTPTTTAEPTPSPTPSPTPTATPIDADQIIEVGPGTFRFVPETVDVAVGDEVAWVWKTGGHNVVVNEQPDGASWEGTAGGPGTTYDPGHVLRHTFDVAGKYSYYCAPHRSTGMVGSVTVVE